MLSCLALVRVACHLFLIVGHDCLALLAESAEWLADKRHGFGVYTSNKPGVQFKYEGRWEVRLWQSVLTVRMASGTARARWCSRATRSSRASSTRAAHCQV